jgi:hypothetical protein
VHFCAELLLKERANKIFIFRLSIPATILRDERQAVPFNTAQRAGFWTGLLITGSTQRKLNLSQ